MSATLQLHPLRVCRSDPERLNRSFSEMVIKTDSCSVTADQLLTALFSIKHSLQDASRFARELLAEFVSLMGIINAPWERISSVADISYETWLNLQLARRLSTLALREPLGEPVIIGSYSNLYDYLSLVIGHDKTESARVLYLNSKNHLIKDEVHGIGTVGSVAIYPREVVTRACELRASSVILAHNHPSGDPTPSKQDVLMTEKVSRALDCVGVVLHDHVIVGRNSHYSFKCHKLI